MARKSGLPKGTLGSLIEETERAEPAAASAAMSHEALPVRPRARKARKVVPGYTTRSSRRTSKPSPSRPAVAWETDPVSRYAATRGLPSGVGAVPALRLAMQFAMDVRDVARKERTSVFGVVSKALAGYLNSYDRL